jgi:hypothetical protein
VLAVERRPSGRSTFDRLSPRVGDHDKLNLNRLSANCCDIRYHRHEPSLLKAGDQVMAKAMGKHQGLGDAVWNVGKPFAVRVRPLSLWFLPRLDCQGNYGERMDGELLMERNCISF